MVLANDTLAIELVFSPVAREVRRLSLTLPKGAKVADALTASGWPDLPASVDAQVGIWGRKALLETVLHDQDRVEVYRALTVDPKEARRVRYRVHAEKLLKGHRKATRA